MRILFAVASLAALAAPAPALADAVFGREAVRGFVEARAAAADGERSWLDRGFGRTGLSGARDGGWRTDVALSQAVVEWRPQFGFNVSAVVSAQYQAGVKPGLDLDEAFLKVRLPPSPAGRASFRAGWFYPPVSFEHEGPGWSTTDLVSASALNTWVGEEGKVGGLEATVQRPFGEHDVALTVGGFKYGDTAGTLLTFRGWSTGGVRAGAKTRFDLPPLSTFAGRRQAAVTDPSWELDDRPGAYARLQWRPPAPVVIELFHSDNFGDRVAVKNRQWSWETRYTVLGARWAPDARTTVKAQALEGRTWMGYARPRVWWDVPFRAGYVQVARDLSAQDRVTVRLDAFETEDRTFVVEDDNRERGWAATAGVRRVLTPRADLLVEAQRIESDRPSRALAREARRQGQTVLQSALRLKF